LSLKSSNIDAKGFAVNPNAPVIDRSLLESRAVNLSNVDNLGYVIDSSKPVFNVGEKALFDMDNMIDMDVNVDGLAGLVDIFLIPFLPVLVPAMFMAILARIFDSIYFFMKTLVIPSILLILILTFVLPNISYAIKKGKDLGFLYHRLWILNYILGFIICYTLMHTNMVRFIEGIGKKLGHASTIGGSVKDIIILTILYGLRFLIPLIIIPIIQKLLWFLLKDKIIYNKIQARL